MTPDPDYVAWDTTSRGGLASLLPIENVPDEDELSEGIPRADGFPPDAAFRMNPSYPRDVRLADAVRSEAGSSLPIVSPALRAILEGFAPPDFEVLPVTIYDHKGRVASDAYVIANSFHIVDCLDLEQMTVEWNPLDPDFLISCEGVVLDPEKLAGAPALFRAKGLENRVLVRRDVADALAAAGMTGVWCEDLDEVTG
jgi:hypothetical protein